MTHCTIFVLADARFTRLFRRSRVVRKAVREAAAKRGFSLDFLDEEMKDRAETPPALEPPRASGSVSS